jgi:NAD(P)-dependent dehydrogenase (short-subunit alcohol dehydrogenase family)
VAALAGGAEFASYCASKAGLLALMRVMAVELAVHRIRVNAVSPGPVDTPFTAGFVSDEQRDQLRRSFPVIPMNRMARPEEVADAFAFLASDDAAYITGHNLVVDGGLIVQLGRGRAWPEGESAAPIAPATG